MRPWKDLGKALVSSRRALDEPPPSDCVLRPGAFSVSEPSFTPSLAPPRNPNRPAILLTKGGGLGHEICGTETPFHFFLDLALFAEPFQLK